MKTIVVLVAEDDSDEFGLLSLAVQSSGVAVCLKWVQDGQLAVNYLAGCGPYADRTRFPLPDVVLLDIKMPRLSGLDVLRWRLTQPRLRSLPMIILSNSGLEADRVEAEGSGAFAFFTKPSSFDDYRKMLRAILSFCALKEAA